MRTKPFGAGAGEGATPKSVEMQSASDRQGSVPSFLRGAVIACAPLRMSLAGGGTDLPSYADRYGGILVSLAISRVVCVAVFPRMFGDLIRASLATFEQVSRAADLKDPLTRAALRRVGAVDGLQIASFSDVPIGTGLGGSGAFTVALLHALRYEQRPTPTALAEEASQIEMIDVGRPVGKHDQYMAAFGGFRILRVGQDREISVETLPVTEETRRYLDQRLLLFFTGKTRDAGRILTVQVARAARDDETAIGSLHAIRDLAETMIDSLHAGRVDDIGPLLGDNWRHKKRLSRKITTPRIDSLYAEALAAGAEGGKVLGAGGGGFLLVACGEGRQAEVRAAMARAGAPELPFQLATEGSRGIQLSV